MFFWSLMIGRERKVLLYVNSWDFVGEETIINV